MVYSKRPVTWARPEQEAGTGIDRDDGVSFYKQTTALALAPLLIAGSIPGHEIEHPMAMVILAV
jgi:hypothetical protein